VSAPTIGRIVHYVAHGTPIRVDGTQAYPSACRAAVVTQIQGPAVVGLAVLNPSGMFFHEACGYASAESKLGGTWHWPELIP
jgi:hypothetical protein